TGVSAVTVSSHCDVGVAYAARSWLASALNCSGSLTFFDCVVRESSGYGVEKLRFDRTSMSTSEPSPIRCALFVTRAASTFDVNDMTSDRSAVTVNSRVTPEPQPMPAFISQSASPLLIHRGLK